MCTLNKSQLFVDSSAAEDTVVTSDAVGMNKQIKTDALVKGTILQSDNYYRELDDTSSEIVGGVKKVNKLIPLAMSRRKQNKPRHFSEGEDPTGLTKEEHCKTIIDSKVTEEIKNISGPVEMNTDSTSPNSAPKSQLQSSLQKTSEAESPTKMPIIFAKSDSDNSKYMHHKMMPQLSTDKFHQTGMHMELKQAVVPPFPRNGVSSETNHIQHLPAAGPRYFHSVSYPPNRIASINHTPQDHINRDQEYSDDEDVPSDVESCEVNEVGEKDVKKTSHGTGHHHVMSSAIDYHMLPTPAVDAAKYNKALPVEDDQHLKQSKNAENNDIDNVSDEDDEDENGGESDLGSSNGAVKLKALETTNVAVAQVVEEGEEGESGPEGESSGNLPNLQQVLFTLHQQQMFQLQVLQQIQNQVTKLAHTDGEDPSAALSGILKANPALAMFGMPWLGRGLASQLQQQRSDESCGADDISETSLVSNDTQEEQGLIDNEEDAEGMHDTSFNAVNRNLDRELSDDMMGTPLGSPEDEREGASPISTPDKTPPSIGEEADEGNHLYPSHSSTPIRHMPPLPYLGGISHFMPGNPHFNPLLPSNMNPHSMQMPLMPGRFPMFRTPVLPRPEEDDPMEEFMEIDTSDTNKLEEFMKKMEPTLSDPNQCAICKKVLSCKSALQMHYRTHTGSRPFKCKICGRAFTTKGNLKTHMSVHRTRTAGPPLHQCPVCAKRFSSILHAQEHMRIHFGEIHAQSMGPRPPVMPVLPQGFMQMPGMMGYPLLPPALPQEKPQRLVAPASESINLLQTTPITIKPLNVSPNFEPKSPLLNHNSPTVQVKRPPVDSVEELRQKRQKIDSSNSTHITNNEVYKPDNPYIFSPHTPHKDDPENKNHPDFNPYSASLQALEESVKEMDKKITQSSSNFFIKSEISPTDSSSRKFLDSYNSHDDSPVRPSQNGYHEKDSGNNNRKESVQTSVITPTPISSTSPASPSTDVNHRQHSPPSCPTSPFSSSRRQTLRHICNVCHKPFSSSSALQIHMRTHTGERPFKCNVCDKAFTTKGNLKVHMGTHAVVTGPPRRGRRMSMDNIPAFANPGQFPPVMPRPPMHMFPGLPFHSAMNNMFLSGMHPGKGLPFMPTIGMPGVPILSPTRRDSDTDRRESSVSPNEIKDYNRASDSPKENNNIPSKGIHGELDLSTRSQAIKT